ncbi:MAG: hypothetical protein ABSE25_09365 [Syntrophorhabdales bacterium]
MARPVRNLSAIHWAQVETNQTDPMPAPSHTSETMREKRLLRFSAISPNTTEPTTAPSIVADPRSPPSGREMWRTLSKTGMAMASTIRS